MSTYKYTGDGSQFISGIPTRDLSEQEFQNLAAELQKAALESKLYLAPASASPAKAKSVNKETDHAE